MSTAIKQKRQRLETLPAAKARWRPPLTWHQCLTRLLVRNKSIPIGSTLLVMVLGLALNILGDGIRDVLDPRLRKG